VQEFAKHRLVQLGKVSVPPLLAALAGPAARRRKWNAADVLAALDPSTRVIDVLVRGLGDNSWNLGAQRALVKIGPAAEPALIKALQSGEKSVSGEARTVLLEIQQRGRIYDRPLRKQIQRALEGR